MFHFDNTEMKSFGCLKSCLVIPPLIFLISFFNLFLNINIYPGCDKPMKILVPSALHMYQKKHCQLYLSADSGDQGHVMG